jgi:hypothetical protein
MKQLRVRGLLGRCFINFILWSIIFIMTSFILNAQELPPRPTMTTPGTPEAPPRPVTAIASISQNLSFGAFYQGNSGGSVIIFPNGSRSSSGDIVLLNMGYSFSAGFYDLVANQGTIVSILAGSDAILTGSNGGSLTLRIGDSDPASPFVISSMPPNATQLRIGGTLIVGNPLSNPAGDYSGTFDITFVQE